MDPYVTLNDYLDVKSFKMSDAYSVEIFDREPAWKRDVLHEVFDENDIKVYGIETQDDEGGYRGRTFRFKNCTGFTVPAYEPQQKELKFCNTTRVVYLPADSKNPGQATLSFTETERQYIYKFIRYFLRKSFYDESVKYDRDSYSPYRYVDRVRIDVWNNDLTKKMMSHIFESCRIYAYDYAYKLDYAEAGTLNPTLTFSFLSYKIDLMPEKTDSEEEMEDYAPADSVSMTGYSAAMAAAAASSYGRRR